ncbi:peptidase M16 [Pseudomonas sp. FW300-N1A1]|uniref:M16 family metallopeptidase n=1 Tax=Pseudomonas sp. FW300-N1A1 TaxID=2075555 RepID=UPI000CD2B014|nr:pitrilysin family protein [Pseudomonas sp. FW300-N1A1]POA22443.1 peptidase M16 [Pseudomonas sp. FW300-N1A1]
MNIYRNITLLLGGLLPCLAVATSTSVTHEFSLENGLKVLVREDHRAPVVTSQLWLKVGSSHELPGQSGVSHALEHMLYKGSSKTCPGEASAILARLGASENAFTNKDFTTYSQTMPPHRINVAFELMADLITTAHLRAEDFSNELEVIKQERREYTDDEPLGLAMERLHSIAFPASPYATPVIGWMHDLQRMNTTRLRQWYQDWYAPNNATLVIVGDVTVVQIKPLVQRYFGAIARRAVPEAPLPLELAEPGERKIVLHQPVHAPSLLMTFNVPSQTTTTDLRTVHALRLLDILLAGSNGSRLKKQLLLTEQLFSEITSGYNSLTRGDSLLTISAQLHGKQPSSLDQAQARVWQLLDELKTTPPTSDELERARTLLIANKVYEQDSIESLAAHMGLLESIGLSWRSMEQDLNELNKVTAEDIQQAANTYLTRQRLSVAYVQQEQTND